MEDYTPNSHKYKAQQSNNNEEERRKVERVVNGKVRTRKKNELRKFAGLLVSDKSDDVGSDILFGVVIPTFKDLISGVVDTMLYGESSRRRSKSGAGNQRTPYRNYFSHAGDDPRSVPARGVRIGYEVEEVIVDQRSEADDVLRELDDIIAEYGLARVADFYEAVGITPRYTDNKYGWTDLRNAYVDKVRSGWLIKLPKPMALN